jgi:tol-pal system protein YbgF
LQSIRALEEELQELRGTLEKQLHQLEDQVMRLKKSQQDFYVDIDKRLRQIETQKPKIMPKKASDAPSSQSYTPAVVVPAGSPPVEATAPKIVPAAVAASTDAKTGIEREGERSQVVDAAPAANEGDEKEAYNAAAAHLSAKQFPEAIQSFESFIQRYPQGQQIAQAHYWLGEAYMASFEANRSDQSLLDKAASAFLVVTTRFPTHQRATDALLKLGMVEQEKGNKILSRQYFQQVKERYPDSGAARLAEAYLQAED